MTIDVDIEFGRQPKLPLDFGPTATDVLLIAGNCNVLGWTVQDASGEVPADVSGSVTSPGAGATIATTGALAAGTYIINWTVGLLGAAAAADANNFQLADTAGNVLASINPGAAGQYPQAQAEVVLAAGNTVLVKSIGAGTVGVTYEVQLVVQPTQVPDVNVQLKDAGQPIARISVAVGQSQTVNHGDIGIQVVGSLTVHPISGTVSGTVYVNPFP